MVGPMPQKVANGHSYIIVAINYFTKWVEDISLFVAKMKNIAKFMRKDIICRYSVPSKIITYNACHAPKPIPEGP